MIPIPETVRKVCSSQGLSLPEKMAPGDLEKALPLIVQAIQQVSNLQKVALAKCSELTGVMGGEQ